MSTILRQYFSPFVRRNEELTLLQIFKPMYLLLSALGLIPYSIEFPSSRRAVTVSLKMNTFNLACYVLLILAIPLGFGLHMLDLSIASRHRPLTKHGIMKINYIITLIFELVVSITIYVCAVKYKKLYVTIFSEMAACWDELSDSTTSEINLILAQLRVQVNCVVFGSLLLVVSVNSAISYSQHLTAGKMILVAVTFVLPAVLQYASVAFFLTMILMVVALLKNIEEHINTLVHKMRTCDVENDCGGIESGPAPASLRQLRREYARALAVKRQVNVAFQAPLLLILAQTTHMLVIVVHMLYHILTFQTAEYYKHNILELTAWMFYQLIKIYAIGHSGALLNQQANKIGRSLHDIPVNTSEDIRLHLQVQHFASLMTFERTEITVFGYFSLETSLIFNILASAATYVVILVQLDNPF